MLARLCSLPRTIATLFARLQPAYEQIRTRRGVISAVEVEQVLKQHPAVADAAAFGIFDLFQFAHTLHAVVSKKSGAQISSEELAAYCRSHLAESMVPVEIEIWESVPKNGYGVVNKSAVLRRQFSFDMFPPAA